MYQSWGFSGENKDGLNTEHSERNVIKSVGLTAWLWGCIQSPCLPWQTSIDTHCALAITADRLSRYLLPLLAKFFSACTLIQLLLSASDKQDSTCPWNHSLYLVFLKAIYTLPVFSNLPLEKGSVMSCYKLLQWQNTAQILVIGGKNITPTLICSKNSKGIKYNLFRLSWKT